MTEIQDRAVAAAESVPSAEFRAWRLLTWSGPVFLVGMLSSFALIAGFLPPPSQDWSAERIAEFYRDDEVRIRIGMEGMILFACCYYTWSVAVSRLMEVIEGPRGLLSRIQLFGGLGTTFVTTICAILWLVASFRVDSRNPEDIRMLNDVSFFIFEMGAMVTLFQIVAFAAVFLFYPGNDGLVPRWVGYFSIWVAATFFGVYLMPSFDSGPFAWHGLINFYLVLGLFFAWMPVVTWYIVKAIPRIEQRSARPTQ